MRLIEDFEEKAYPIDEAPPRAVLKILMDDRGLKQIDLAPLFGGHSHISDVLAGKRQISKAQAKALSAFFKVPADLLSEVALGPYMPGLCQNGQEIHRRDAEDAE